MKSFKLQFYNVFCVKAWSSPLLQNPSVCPCGHWQAQQSIQAPLKHRAAVVWLDESQGRFFFLSEKKGGSSSSSFFFFFFFAGTGGGGARPPPPPPGSATAYPSQLKFGRMLLGLVPHISHAFHCDVRRSSCQMLHTATAATVVDRCDLFWLLPRVKFHPKENESTWYRQGRHTSANIHTKKNAKAPRSTHGLHTECKWTAVLCGGTHLWPQKPKKLTKTQKKIYFRPDRQSRWTLEVRWPLSLEIPLDSNNNPSLQRKKWKSEPHFAIFDARGAMWGMPL